MTWDKLCLELELLNEEEPGSLLPLLIGIHSILHGDEFQDWCVRNINFMAYELVLLCEKKSEAERFRILNEFFFQQKDFHITQLSRKQLREQDYLIRFVLSERSGATLPLALVYIHLATEIGLPLALVNIESLSVLKWLRGNHCDYLDMARGASLLDDESILEIITHKRPNNIDSKSDPKLEVLKSKNILTLYLEDLRDIYRHMKDLDLHHAVLSMLLKLDPNNLNYLGDRALVRKQLGFEKEALTDLKRYTSFMDMAAAPQEIQRAFKEIHAMSLDTPETLH